MSVCDICNEPLGDESYRYTSSQMKKAVQNGFCPPSDPTSLSGVADATLANMFGVPLDTAQDYM